MNSWDLKTLRVASHSPEILSSASDGRAVVLEIPAGESLTDHQVHERAWIVVVDGDVEFALYEGTVGRGAAIEFTGFLRVFRSLPSLDAILLNPATAPIPAEPSALCAVATGLARRTTEQNFAAVSQYADRLAREYGTLLIKAATARLPGLAAGVVAAFLRAPLLAVIVIAAGTTALARALT